MNAQTRWIFAVAVVGMVFFVWFLLPSMGSAQQEAEIDWEVWTYCLSNAERTGGVKPLEQILERFERNSFELVEVVPALDVYKDGQRWGTGCATYILRKVRGAK